MAWLTNWQYKKSHILNFASGAGTGYQMKVIVYYGAGTDTGNAVYLNGKCRTDFADVRFTDDDGTTLLDYWLESKVDSDNAVFWVKVNDDLSTANQSIYVYYGNATATTANNGVNTFIFFEPFNSLDAWTVIDGTWSADGVCHQTDGANTDAWQGGLKLTTPPTVKARRVSVKIKTVDAAGNNYVAFSGKWNTADDLLHSEFRKEAAPVVRNHARVGGVWKTGREVSYDAGYNVWHRLTTGIDGEGNVKTWAEGIEKLSFFDADWDKLWTFINLHTHSAKVDFDDLFVAKYTHPEPTDGAWGSEEALKIINEVLNVIEAKNYCRGRLKVISEVLNVVEAFNKLQTKLRVVSETINILELKNKLQTKLRVVIETVRAIEAKNYLKNLIRIISEFLNISETKNWLRKRIRQLFMKKSIPSGFKESVPGMKKNLHSGFKEEN